MRQPRILFVGGSGHHYLRRAVRSPGLGLIVIDPDAPGAAEAMAERVGFSVHAGDLASAIERHQPDVVSVGSVYGRAGDYTAAARRLGLPVVTDKPAAATWEQLELLEQLGGMIVTEFDWRAQPALLAARELVQSGELGQMVLAVAQKTYPLGNRPAFYKERTLYGGTMLWVASHGIDALRFVCGPLTPISARHGNAGSANIAPAEDHAVATFALADGGTAIAHADLARPTGFGTHGDDRLIVRCQGGEVEVRDGACTVTTDKALRVVELPSAAPLEQQLLSAVAGEGDGTFGTQETLKTARLLLQCRDLAD
ncbi:MAG: Gfo/Idh/MocA family oxidoreductase [Planctomycetota bacterium]